tara:strand:- start:1202 stop:1471 length:270 start_codon:yes stop_codon:yes gene_type:complete
MKDIPMCQSDLSCPKCNGEMIQGYVLDKSVGGVSSSQWAEGKPVRRTYFGFVVAEIKIPKSEEVIPIGTFRCQSCGYLESYACGEFAVK